MKLVTASFNMPTFAGSVTRVTKFATRKQSAGNTKKAPTPERMAGRRTRSRVFTSNTMRSRRTRKGLLPLPSPIVSPTDDCKEEEVGLPASLFPTADVVKCLLGAETANERFARALGKECGGDGENADALAIKQMHLMNRRATIFNCGSLDRGRPLGRSLLVPRRCRPFSSTLDARREARRTRRQQQQRSQR